VTVAEIDAKPNSLAGGKALTPDEHRQAARA